MVVGVEGSLQDPSREDDAVLSGHVVGINCRRSHTPSGGGQETREGLGGGGEEERKEGEGEELICGPAIPYKCSGIVFAKCQQRRVTDQL